MSDENGRQGWTARTAELLTRELGPLGFTPEECGRLADYLHGLDVWNTTPDDVLRELLLIQGVGPVNAGRLVHDLPSLDWNKIMVGGGTARDLLESNSVSLLRFRQRGKLVPPVEQAPHGGLARLVTYWLHDLLYNIAYSRHIPVGQGHERFPYVD